MSDIGYTGMPDRFSPADLGTAQLLDDDEIGQLASGPARAARYILSGFPSPATDRPGTSVCCETRRVDSFRATWYRLMPKPVVLICTWTNPSTV